MDSNCTSLEDYMQKTTFSVLLNLNPCSEQTEVYVQRYMSTKFGMACRSHARMRSSCTKQNQQLSVAFKLGHGYSTTIVVSKLKCIQLALGLAFMYIIV